MDYKNEALERAEISYRRVHDVRHSFASAVIGTGTSLHIMGKMIGNTTDTERYAHLAEEAKQAAADATAKVLA